jgi:hypothetical protein
MNRQRTLIIVAIVVIVVVVVGVGVYVVTYGSGISPTASATPTPTATSAVGPTSSGTAPPTPSGAVPTDVAHASSLQYTYSVTNSSGLQSTETHYMKNIGASNLMIRIEVTYPSGTTEVTIVNGALQKMWTATNGEWTDISSTLSMNDWNNEFATVELGLKGWSGVGDWTYTDPNGNIFEFTSVVVNPSLPDSMFTH